MAVTITLGGLNPSQQTVTTPGAYNVSVVLGTSNPSVTFSGPQTFVVDGVTAVAAYTIEAVDGATVDVDGLATVASTANLIVDSTSTMTISSAISALSALNASFTGVGGTLGFAPGLLSALSTLPTISGFAAGDNLDLGTPYAAGDQVVYSPTTGVLNVENAASQVIASVKLVGTYSQGNFSVVDNSGVVQVANSAPCYCPGTRIATPSGEVAVETLAMGDVVVTASGERCPVRWIGWRSYAGRFIAGNHLILPVTIRAGALADGVPRRDLTVSPGHAIWIDGHLVPAWRLLNGVTVTQAADVEEVTYIHVELDHHTLLVANGAAAESFLEETGFRNQFHNAAEFHAAYLDAAPMAPMQARLEDGFALRRIQRRLARRAGLPLTVRAVGELRGFVDQAGPDRVCGWAQDLNSPEEPVCLELRVNGSQLLEILANRYRADLRRAGLGSGCHAFQVDLPCAGEVTVRRAADRALLANTDAALERRVA